MPTAQDKAHAAVPGAGAYNIETAQEATGTTAPAWTMGKQIPARTGDDVFGPSRILPGAGEYDLAGVAYSRITPGPGAYDVAEKIAEGGSFRGPAVVIGQQGRTDEWLAGEARKEEGPGPGRYERALAWGEDGQGVAFTKAAQRRSDEYTNVPGVGEYELRDKVVDGGVVHVPGGILGLDRRVTMGIGEEWFRETPGAGTYEVVPGVTRTGVERAKGGDFGTEVRATVWHKGDADEPGPAHYQVCVCVCCISGGLLWDITALSSAALIR
jgi:hypothetical protein